jgi:hypothetical protein
MAAKKDQQTPKRKKQRASAKEMQASRKALSKGDRTLDTGQPGGGRGRVDVTGIMAEDIRIDPNLTEGHPGYQESGDSEIVPTERLSRGRATKNKASR